MIPSRVFCLEFIILFKFPWKLRRWQDQSSSSCSASCKPVEEISLKSSLYEENRYHHTEEHPFGASWCCVHCSVLLLLSSLVISFLRVNTLTYSFHQHLSRHHIARTTEHSKIDTLCSCDTLSTLDSSLFTSRLEESRPRFRYRLTHQTSHLQPAASFSPHCHHYQRCLPTKQTQLAPFLLQPLLQIPECAD